MLFQISDGDDQLVAVKITLSLRSFFGQKCDGCIFGRDGRI